jgi:hypothetical protein
MVMGVAPASDAAREAATKRKAWIDFIVRLSIAITVILAIGLYACSERIVPPPQSVRAPAPRPTPPPVATTPPAASLGADWRDWPLTPGNWSYRAEPSGPVASFGMAGGDTLFTAQCNKGAGNITIARAGMFAAGETGRMSIRTSSGTATFQVSNAGTAPSFVATPVASTDSQLDNIAFSRGRFVVSVKGATDLVIPSWPEFAKVVEDCRG